MRRAQATGLGGCPGRWGALSLALSLTWALGGCPGPAAPEGEPAPAQVTPRPSRVGLPGAPGQVGRAGTPPPAPALGEEAPLTLPEGRGVVIGSLGQTVHAVEGARGLPVVLHVWATWCAPCADELDQLAAVAPALTGAARVIGISLDGAREPVSEALKAKVLAFMGRSQASWPTVLFDGQKQAGLLAWLGMRDGAPMTLILGPDGARWASYQRPVTARDVLDALSVHGVDVSAARDALVRREEARALVIPDAHRPDANGPDAHRPDAQEEGDQAAPPP